MTPALSDRQERFVHEYLIDQNASAAARRAGYAASTRGAQAAALMNNPLVRERIRLGLADLFASLHITALNLLRAQARAAFFDPRKLFDPTGRPIPLHLLDEDTVTVLTVHFDERPSGEIIKRVRQPPRHTALAALEKRYAQFMEMELEMLDAASAQEQVQPESKTQVPLDPPAAERAPDAPMDTTEHKTPLGERPTVPAPDETRMPRRQTEPAPREAPSACEQAAPARDPAHAAHPDSQALPFPTPAQALVPAPAPEPPPAFLRLRDPNLLWHGTTPAAPPAQAAAPGVMARPGLGTPADAMSRGSRTCQPDPRQAPGSGAHAALEVV